MESKIQNNTNHWKVNRKTSIIKKDGKMLNAVYNNSVIWKNRMKNTCTKNRYRTTSENIKRHYLRNDEKIEFLHGRF